MSERVAPTSRDDQIIAMRAEGATLDNIGQVFGISRERVRQIVVKSGGPTSATARAAARARAQEYRDATTRAIRALLSTEGPTTPDLAAEALHLTRGEVVDCWPKDLRHFMVRRRGSVEQVWSDDEVLDAIREAAVYEFPLTSSTYNELIRSGQVVGPSLPRVTQRMGSWSAACDLAGVEHGQALRDTYQSQWTQADLLSYVREFFSDPRTPHSAKHFDAWRRERATGAPSLTTLRHRIGTWSDIKRQALGRDVN